MFNRETAVLSRTRDGNCAPRKGWDELAAHKTSNGTENAGTTGGNVRAQIDSVPYTGQGGMTERTTSTEYAQAPLVEGGSGNNPK